MYVRDTNKMYLYGAFVTFLCEFVEGATRIAHKTKQQHRREQ